MNGAWSTAKIGSKEADIYEPPDLLRPRFGVLHLHGIGLESLRERPAFTRCFDELKVVCLCPRGGRSWWADRLCPEFDTTITPEHYLLDQVLPYFGARWQMKPDAIGLHGISMGGQGALRLAFKYADLFPVVA